MPGGGIAFLNHATSYLEGAELAQIETAPGTPVDAPARENIEQRDEESLRSVY
jgi:hypothetical protein